MCGPGVMCEANGAMSRAPGAHQVDVSGYRDKGIVTDGFLEILKSTSESSRTTRI